MSTNLVRNYSINNRIEYHKLQKKAIEVFLYIAHCNNRTRFMPTLGLISLTRKRGKQEDISKTFNFKRSKLLNSQTSSTGVRTAPYTPTIASKKRKETEGGSDRSQQKYTEAIQGSVDWFSSHFFCMKATIFHIQSCTFHQHLHKRSPKMLVSPHTSRIPYVTIQQQ